jgi:branched-chain amino acid transport system permease protein
MSRGLRWAGASVALVLLVAFPLVVTKPFPRHVMITIFLYAMLAQAWNLLAGYCGQISLGHAVFFGTGAYTSTLLLKYLNLTPWGGMLAGVVVAVVGLIALRRGAHVARPGFARAPHAVRPGSPDNQAPSADPSPRP